MCRVGFKDAIILSNNTPRFRTCRKFLRKGLGPGAVQSFIPFLNPQNAFFVEELAANPDSYVEIFKRYAPCQTTFLVAIHMGTSLAGTRHAYP